MARTKGLIDEKKAAEVNELSVALPDSGSCYAAAVALRSLAEQLEKHKHRRFKRIRMDRETKRIVFELRPEVNDHESSD